MAMKVNDSTSGLTIITDRDFEEAIVDNENNSAKEIHDTIDSVKESYNDDLIVISIDENSSEEVEPEDIVPIDGEEVNPEDLEGSIDKEVISDYTFDSIMSIVDDAAEAIEKVYADPTFDEIDDDSLGEIIDNLMDEDMADII